MAVYNIKEMTQIKRRIPYDRISCVTRSLLSSEFVIHVLGEHDYWIASFDYRG